MKFLGGQGLADKAWRCPSIAISTFMAISECRLTIHLDHDRICHPFKLLLLSFILSEHTSQYIEMPVGNWAKHLLFGGGLVVVEPGNGLVDFGREFLFVAGFEFLIDLGIAQSVA